MRQVVVQRRRSVRRRTNTHGARVGDQYDDVGGSSYRSLASTRIPILVTTIVRAGTGQGIQVTGDVTNNHVFVNDGRTFLEITNNSAVTQTVTIEPAHNLTLDGLTIDPQLVIVAPGKTSYSGPFTISTFKQDTANDIYVDVQSSLVLLRAYRLP